MSTFSGRKAWLAAVACATAVAFVISAARAVPSVHDATPAPSNEIVTERVDASARVAAAGGSSWTPSRMRATVAAVPRQERVRPRARRARKRKVHWTAENPAARRANPDLPGTRVIGRLFSKRPDGRDWVCSATLVESANRSLIWTAGHCVHSGRGGGPHTDIAFVPGYRPAARGGPAPFGVWPAVRSGTTRAFAREGSPTRFRRDVGAVVLARDGLGRTLTDVLGAAQHIAFGRRAPARAASLGYPGLGRFDGETLYKCGPNRTGRVRGALGRRVVGRRVRGQGPRPRAVACAHTEGTSGGPWLARANRKTGIGTIVGVTSVLSKTGPWMFSPVQDRVARGLYNRLSRSPN